MKTTQRPPLYLLLLSAAAVLFYCTDAALEDLETNCSRQDDFTLDFDLFMELLSNHTEIARGLNRAPIFGDMDPDIPAYEIAGTGRHFTNSLMSKDIKRALCNNNEVTFYASMYLIEGYSSGTLLEIYSGNGVRLPVFGMYFNAAANEILFTYRHRGIPHTVSVDQRLHTGRWRKYAFVLSGHLLEFYYDCQLVFSDIVKLPDFCIEDESFSVAFADDSEGSADVVIGNNGIHAFFEQVGFFIGRGGLGKQCPGAGNECPTCGQFLNLVEKAHDLHAENDLLREENEALKAEVDLLRNFLRPQPDTSLECIVEGEIDPVEDGEFIVIDFGICFCKEGELSCDFDMICEDNSTIPERDRPLPPPACVPPCSLDHQSCIDGKCECDVGFVYNNISNKCVDQMCRNVNNEDLLVGESSYLYQDRDDTCRIFTCKNFGSFLGATSISVECSGMDDIIDTMGCDPESLSSMNRSLAVCCQKCEACIFHPCLSNAHCVSTNNVPECVCDKFYKMNEDGECVDIDECAEDPGRCGANGLCINEVATPNNSRGYSCECLDGFFQNIIGDCLDINECFLPNICPANAICTNTIGSFTCECDPGYEKTSDGQCIPICVDPCLNGGTCVAPDTCECLPGYQGPLCRDDVNECVTGLNMCTDPFSECVNTIGGHFCRCITGYRGNGTYCEDIDECESDIHNCVVRSRGGCLNTDGSYICLCDNVDCTGSCKRRGTIYANHETFVDENDECDICTCINGEIFCHQRSCDGDCRTDEVTRKCCSKCKSRDCYLELEDRNETILLRPDSIWVDPRDPCTQWHCSPRLVLTEKDLTPECPPLHCDERFRVSPMGRCCPICLLPPCTADKEGVTLPLANGCEECTCENSEWNCTRVVSCPSTNCAPEDVLFYEDGCCPICESDVLGSTCKTLLTN